MNLSIARSSGCVLVVEDFVLVSMLVAGQSCLKALSVYAGASWILRQHIIVNCEETEDCSGALEFMAMAGLGIALIIAVVVVGVAVEAAVVVAPPAQVACPLDFSILGRYPCDSSRTECGSCADVWSRLNFVVAQHVRRTGLFLLPAEAAEACMAAFQVELEGEGLSIKLNSSCGIGPSVVLKNSSSCPDIESVEDYKRAVPALQVEQIDEKCTEFSSLPACTSCYTASTYSVSNGSAAGSGQNCLNYSYIYAAAVVNRAGPLDPWVAFCFFYLLTDSGGDGSQQHRRLIVVSTVVPAAGLLIVLSVLSCFCWRRRKKQQDENKGENQLQRPMMTSAVEFSIQELRAATGGFSAANSIGSGGFGNVFKGVLPDGTQIAVKRFKNCSPAGDAQFVNEVETISSVRHRNLVPLLGWCVHSTAAGGQQHQRFIVYEFMPNGSLGDHRRGMRSWEARKKIVIGVARGLAYLHSGAMPRIIHRDIKGSNILLDAELNARISDLGLARFVPEGVSRITTGVVGTQGYVAPEYVLYEQLTDRSDVYSFGIVLLEILTGKRALLPPSSTPIADWAWNLVKQGRIRDVVLSGLEDADDQEMERFLAVGFLCAHPYVACRPSMVGALKMLEDSGGVPERIPDRPVPSRADVEMSSSGYQSTTYLNSSLSAR